MANKRVKFFVETFNEEVRNVCNEAELRVKFHLAASNCLGYNDLKIERQRQDLRRNRVIIEFKDKGLFAGSKSSAKFKEALTQLTKNYILKQSKFDNRSMSDYIGVCFDGIHLAFVFIENNGYIRVTDLRQFDENSASSLVMALDKDDRIELTAENVNDDFGPNSSIAANIINELWNHFVNKTSLSYHRVEMLFIEWKDVFEQTTNLGRIGQEKLESYIKPLGLPPKADLTKVLFVLNTYHALFFKLLAAEVILANTLITGLRSDYCFGTSSLNNLDLINSLTNDIEESNLFRQSNILNFIEGTFFSWYLIDPPNSLIESLRLLMQRISLYRLSGLALGRTRDIVKRIYQELIPSPLRHSLGEYFTPEWLVEYTLERVGYNGPDILLKKYLDPCCGSGNFLIHTINRYKEQAKKAGWSSENILKGILDHIYGFDLNPLAVLTARVNYLIAISDLIATHSEVEIPIYQADAVYSPTISKHASNSISIRTYQIDTNLASYPSIELDLPEDLIQKNRLLARLLEIMERSIKEDDSEQIFLASINNEKEFNTSSFKVIWEHYLLEMYKKIHFLEKHDWNRIWCRIFRNFFASVAIGECYYIAGNPPWVRWSELPKRYAERIKPTCDSYEIFSKDRFYGGNELDISGIITYTVADKWLSDNGGRLSFILTQSHFQSQSSGGFRQFNIKGTPLKVVEVDDFTNVQPFKGVTNRPAILTTIKGQKTTYPVMYRVWEKIKSDSIPEDNDWSVAKNNLRFIENEANPLNSSGGRWSILLPGNFFKLNNLIGEDKNIKGRKGIVTDLNGAYFIKLLGRGRKQGTIKFQNCHDCGKQPVPECIGEMKTDWIYPLIKGAENIKAFYGTTSDMQVIIPNKKIRMQDIPLVSKFAALDPDALSYFKRINSVKVNNNGLLGNRSTWRTRMKPQYDQKVKNGSIAFDDVPFYAIYDVGDYTFEPYKVVWAEIAGSLQAAVISPVEMPFGIGVKPAIPDHKVYFISFTDIDYAHYVCALLNSEPVRTFIDSFTVKLQVGSLFRFINIPKYNPGSTCHQSLIQYSKEAHAIKTKSDNTGNIDYQIEKINQIAWKLI